MSLWRYILGRLLTGVVTVWFIATATFVAMHAVPGDPLATDKAMSPELRAKLEAQYGLDQPLWQQYQRYIGAMLDGDFGVSFTQANRSVNDIIAEHFPVSASLGIASLLFAFFGALLTGLAAAWWRGRWPDTTIMIAVIAAISVPGFVLAALAQLAIVRFNAVWGSSLIPVAGWGTLSHIWIPAMVLGLGTMAYLSRLLRSSMIETGDAEYVLTARARGLGPWRIFWSHRLRNALLPVVTELGPAVAALTTGGFVVELVFGIPGMGRYFVQAVQQLDYTVIMGLTVFYGSFLVLVVLIVDISYGWIDPRIRIAGPGSGGGR